MRRTFWTKKLAGLCGALLMALLLCGATRTLATDGDPDPTFGNGGKVTTAINGNFGSAYDVVVQPDGKILAAGVTSSAGVLVRFNANGSFDTSFGSGGKVTNGSFDVGFRSVVLQPDGKIVVAGAVGTDRDLDPFNGNFGLARFNANGSLDTNFGNGGVITTDFAGLGDGNRDVELQPDGKIVTVGFAGRDNRNGTSQFDFALARFNANGSLDTSFGSGGKIIADFANGTDSASSVKVQADGKIVVAGTTTSASGGLNRNFALARFNANGNLDTTFGTGGKVTTDFFGDTDMAGDLALQSDGKIVLAGGAKPADSASDFALARYNANGSLDTTFGNGGKVTTDFDGFPDFINHIALQANGKIVAVGNANKAMSIDAALARYNANGSLDTDFGSGGKVIAQFAGDSDGNGVALQPDGKIVLAGGAQSNSGGSLLFALARYVNRDAQAAAPTVRDINLTIPGDSYVAFDVSDFDAAFSGGTLQKIKITSLPAKGRLEVNGKAVTVGQEIVRDDIRNDNFFYFPDGFVGTVNFGYNASNGTSFAATGAKVNITLTGTMAPTLTISKSAPSSVQSGANLTYTISYANTGNANATNTVIRDPLPSGTNFVSATNGGALQNGVVVFNVGALNQSSGNKTVSFTVKVTATSGTVTNANYTIQADGVSAVTGAPVTTTVTSLPPANRAPVAQSQSATTNQNTPVTITLQATDADNDALTYVIVTQPKNGTLSGSASTRTYTPKAGFSGTDSFTFKANDGQADSNVATVTINVKPAAPTNRPPVAQSQNLTTPQDTPISGSVMATDPDNDPLDYFLVRAPQHGTLQQIGTNQFIYTPDAGFVGTDSFTFKANDGKADSNVATVTINVTPRGGGGNAVNRVTGSGVVVANGQRYNFNLNVGSDANGKASGSVTASDGRKDMVNSTQITGLTVSGNTATISGIAVRGRMRYAFTLFVSDTRSGNGAFNVRSSGGGTNSRVISGYVFIGQQPLP